jgi:hypothetical protein
MVGFQHARKMGFRDQRSPRSLLALWKSGEAISVRGQAYRVKPRHSALAILRSLLDAARGRTEERSGSARPGGLGRAVPGDFQKAGRSTVYLAMDAAGAEGSRIIADLFLKADLPVPLKMTIPSGKDLNQYMINQKEDKWNDRHNVGCN